MAGIGEEIEQLARDETRVYLGRHIEEMFVGGPKVSRRQFGNRSPQAWVEDMLEEGALREHPGLAEFAASLEEKGVVPADFTAGILFAALLVQDTTFEY